MWTAYQRTTKRNIRWVHVLTFSLGWHVFCQTLIDVVTKNQRRPYVQNLAAKRTNITYNKKPRGVFLSVDYLISVTLYIKKMLMVYMEDVYSIFDHLPWFSLQNVYLLLCVAYSYLSYWAKLYMFIHKSCIVDPTKKCFIVILCILVLYHIPFLYFPIDLVSFWA